MLHVLFSEAATPRWVLTEDEFLSRIDSLAASRFARTPAGRVSVEAVDELDRIKWRAYFPNASGLVILARQIREGRAAAGDRHG
jgi:hypothetical protein